MMDEAGGMMMKKTLHAETFDVTALLERCFPTPDTLRYQRILEVISAGEDGVFIQYEYELKNGERHRNAEFIAVHGGRLAETRIFFGGRL